MRLTGRSVPQLRQEPITYWFSLPQFEQFSTIEVVMLSYRCSSIKDSVWLCTLRNNELYCDSESPCLGSALLHGFFFLIWSFFFGF